MECISRCNRYAVLHTPFARGVHALSRNVLVRHAGFRAGTREEEVGENSVQLNRIHGGIAQMSEFKLSPENRTLGESLRFQLTGRGRLHKDEHRFRARGITM